MSDPLPPTSEVARELPGYRIEAEIGRGGMAVVYRAEDLGPLRRKKVALKVLAQHFASNDTFRRRFTAEAQIVANLAHPSIIPVYDFGEAGHLLYLVMHYVDGPDLGRLVFQHGRLEAPRLARLVTQVAGALDTAHREGLVHRDVKPANVLIARPGTSDEHAYLGDFGITKDNATGERITGTGEFIGTIDYVAPEQIEGRPLDGRADVYALGAMVYHCLSGEVAYPRGNDVAKLWAHLRDPPPSLAALRPELRGPVDHVVQRAMAKNPDDRYRTCAELAGDLQAAVASTIAAGPDLAMATLEQAGPISGSGSSPPPIRRPPPPLVRRPSRPRRPGVIVAVAVALVVVSGAALLVVARLSGGDGFPSEEEQAMVRRVPAGYRDSCERDEGAPPPGATAAVRCFPDEGAEVASFASFDGDEAMDDHYERELGDSPVVDDIADDCSEDRDAEHDFTDSTGDVGMVFCFRRGEDESTMVWTDARFDTVGRASRADGNDAALYDWWATLADRDPLDNFPVAAERTLLERVPSDFVATCERTELVVDTEIASVLCRPASGADYVYFTQFGDNGAMDARYQQILDLVDAAPDSGETPCPSEGPYTFTPTGADGGRLLCYFDGATARVTWTDLSASMLAQAIRDDGDATALLEFWRSGPN